MNYVSEEQIRNTLIKMTDKIEIKDSILRLRLLKEIDGHKNKKGRNHMKKIIKIAVPVVCFTFILTILFTTPIGQTFADYIKKIFEPKQENILMEGLQEEVNMIPIVEERQEESKLSSYAIYMENESMDRYTIKKDNKNIEYIIPKSFKVADKNNIDESNLEVFMKIEQIVGKNYSVVAQEIMTENIDNGYEKISAKDSTIKDIKQKLITLKNGPMITVSNNAKSKYKQIYCIDNRQGGTFVITIQMPYSSDYMEGWNTRFENMVKSFEINI